MAVGLQCACLGRKSYPLPAECLWCLNRLLAACSSNPDVPPPPLLLAVHFEDQLSSEKKCGHLGGKVLVPTQQALRNIIAGEA